MNGHDVPQANPQASASHLYVIVSLTALAVMLMVLLSWGMGRWSFLPVASSVHRLSLRSPGHEPSAEHS